MNMTLEKLLKMHATTKQLAEHCARYSAPDTIHASIQLITTALPFLALCAALAFSIDYSYWLTLALSVPTAGLVMRFFVIQHDCGHGSFFGSRRANDITGRLLSILTITPYAYWRRCHAPHHASSSNLDRRGIGDVNTLTVEEYKALPPLRRLGYRIYRNPIVLMIFGGSLHFLFLQRFPFYLRQPAWEMWSSVILLDVAIIVVYGFLVSVLGWTQFFMLFAPVIVVSSCIGSWLFFVQHQFEDTHWAKNEKWDRQTAALLGSSYYALPRVLQWVSGNIGLHHIHHLCSRIPNYRLQECLDAEPALKTINRLTLAQSLKSARLALWDESRKKLVGFSAAF